MTTANARFDLKMDANDKQIVSRAAALMGTTMAGFVRAAAKEKAQELLDRQSRVTLSERDFRKFAKALDRAFAPNPALRERSAPHAKKFAVLEERPLDPALHDRQAFDCGVRELNEYLIKFAEQHRRRGVSTTYVLADSSAPQTILGYYTLSAAELDVDSLAAIDRKKLPRFPVPCFRMGRLAGHADRHGTGLGRLLLGSAVNRCMKAREEVAAYALIVDAKNETAKAFYKHFGFTTCLDAPMTLYLPLGKSK